MHFVGYHLSRSWLSHLLFASSVLMNAKLIVIACHIDCFVWHVSDHTMAQCQSDTPAAGINSPMVNMTVNRNAFEVDYIFYFISL